MAIEVIQKTFLILECLADSISPLALGEITRRVKLPKPTIYRMLQTMVELGYVGREKKTGFYLRTAQLERLGQNSLNQDLKRRALPLMERIGGRFNETVNLGVLYGLYVHYVHFIHTTRPLRHMVEPETTDLFYSTALGRAIAAFLPQEEQESLLERVKLESVTPNTVRTKAKLRKVLAETRQRGWALDDEENDIGVICFGVPLLEEGYPRAAISVSLPKSRLTPDLEKDILKELHAIAEAFATANGRQSNGGKNKLASRLANVQS